MKLRKATHSEYIKGVDIYENLGRNALWDFSIKLGVNSFSRCEPCEEETANTQDAAGDCCFICGSLKK